MTENDIALFCYGTLEYPDIMASVTGQKFSGEPALIRDYARYLVRGKVYPAVVEQFGARVRGTVFRGLDKAHIQFLDEYEGPVYRRIECPVELATGDILPAMVYIYPASSRHLLHNRDWDSGLFERKHKIHYMNSI